MPSELRAFDGIIAWQPAVFGQRLHGRLEVCSLEAASPTASGGLGGLSGIRSHQIASRLPPCSSFQPGSSLGEAAGRDLFQQGPDLAVVMSTTPTDRKEAEASIEPAVHDSSLGKVMP